MLRFPSRLAAAGALSSLCMASFAVAQAPAVPTLKAKTKIVVIDVVVTDKEGHPVKDLKASDFALAENGAPQTISHFDAHTSLAAEDVGKIEALPKLPSNVFTNYSPVPQNGSLNVLLLDEFNTQMKAKTVVLKQALQYLSTPHPGARMELFEMNGDSDLRLLQGFTSDPEILKATLMNPKAVPHLSAAVDGTDPCSGNPNGPSDSPSDWTKVKLRASTFPEVYAQAISECEENRRLDRSLSSLRAMEALARYMGGLPGRKNLLWFSSSFWLPQNKRELTDELHRVMALFARNQVAVYPIGARGVEAGGKRAIDNMDADAVTMDIMAEDTGGKVFASSNDIAEEAEQAVNDGANYYTLTYTPADRNWKGEFRKVEVKLAQKGYTLAYRPGYYAEDVDTTAGRDAVAVTESMPADPAKAALKGAMEFGSPQPSDVVLKVAVNPATARPENTVAKLNVLAPKVSAPFERYVLSVAALPQAFTFTRDVPGKIHLAARLVTRVYSADGALINTTTLNAIGDIDDARYQTIMQNGVQFKQEISVPVKGESFLRIGVEDLPTNHVGVVEIPVEMVKKLKPLTTAAK